MFFDFLSKKLEICNNEDWFRVDPFDIVRNGGLSIISQFGDSLLLTLRSLYPEENWNWKQEEDPVLLFFQEPSKRMKIIQFIEKELKIKQLQDWYHVKPSDLVQKGGKSILSFYNGSIHSMLQ